MSRHWSAFAGSCLVVLGWSAGCNYFDADAEKLIRDETGTGGKPGGTGGASNMTAAADFCVSDSVPAREPDDQFLEVETQDLRDDFHDLSTCGISRSLDGVDGFFKVDLVAGERYHFHVKAAAGEDLAVYLLSQCDERTCVGSVDDCPAGTDEHFSFVADTAGTYFLGIDGIGDRTADNPLTFLATRPVCGDGKKQHSEVCDDGNVNPKDGCDDRCRVVLSDGGTETEPNGDRYGANVVQVAPGATSRVRGSIGGPCDSDFYLVRVPQGAELRLTMLTSAGAACQGTDPVRLRLFDSTFAQVTSVTSSGGDCPSLGPGVAANLAAGDYYVSLRTTESVSPFEYSVQFEIVTP
jgi:cysteine-rich repeat protein